VWYISRYNASVYTDMLPMLTTLRLGTGRRRSIRPQKWFLRAGCAAAVIATFILADARLGAAPQTQAKPAAHHAAVSPALAPPDKTYGSKTAPITVWAFTDYQCPGCRALFEQALRPMIEDYVASNKVYLIHHDFPLAMHQYSGQAARWANAAASIGQFASVEAALFDNQPYWSTDGNISKYVSEAMSPADFQRVQAILKPCTTPAPQATTPDVDPLAKSGHSCPVDAYIAPDIKMGYGIPVNYTPTYVVYYKGKKIAASSDIVSWPVLKQFFDSLLSQ
jgi:protein-disulfide isomerase